MDSIIPIEHTLSEDCRYFLNELLFEFSRSLFNAKNTIDRVNQKPETANSSKLRLNSIVRKATWTWKKEAIDNFIKDLQAWKGLFDPLWWTIVLKLRGPLLDSKQLEQAKATEPQAMGPEMAARNPLVLATSIRKVLSAEPDGSLILPELQMDWVNILYSDARAARRAQRHSDPWYIIDTIEVGAATQTLDVWKEVNTLATRLSQADPLAFGLLNCKGVIQVQRQIGLLPNSYQPAPKSYSHFQIVFRIPKGMEIMQSLRQLLLGSDMYISLSKKLFIAQELAKAVYYVHAFDFVHKNVRPESVLYFEDPGSVNSHAFLVGFDAFRAAEAGTMMEGDMTWARNVYRHPSRQGTHLKAKYNMQHDIYSLGVCLLEIGLWQSFVEYDDGSELGGPSQPKSGIFYDEFMAWNKTLGRVSLDVLAIRLKRYLVEQTKTMLAPRMGDKYTYVVLSCLTCLDDENEDFRSISSCGNEVNDDDDDDDAVAMLFIEKIMRSLNSIFL